MPITIQILARIHNTLSQQPGPESVLVWAIAATAFFGFFRLGELLVESPAHFNPAISLAWGDVAVDSRTSPSMVKLHLRRSKCDKFGKGVDIVVGHTDTPLCPVMAILDYIKLRQDHPGAFFRMKDGTPTTKGWFIGKLRGILSSIGLPQGDYAGHSFRIGAATSAAIAGVEDSMIQALGRWQSAAFLQYIRTPRDQLAAISRRLATTVPSPAAGPNGLS